MKAALHRSGGLVEPIFPTPMWIVAFLCWTGPGCIILLALLRHDHRFLNSLIQELPRIDNASVAWALVWWSVGIFAFWAGAALMAVDDRASAQSSTTSAARMIVVLTVGTAAVWLGVVLASHAIGFGVLGQPAPSLPAPVRILLSRGPELLSAAALAAFALCHSLRARATVLASMFVPIALTSWFTTSRGAVILYVLPFLLLEYCNSRSLRFRRRVISAIGLLGACVVLLFPLLSQRRTDLGFGGGGIGSATTATNGNSVTASALRVALRPQGSLGALFMANGDVPNRPSFDLANVVHVYTTNVVHVTLPNDFRSPGMIAGLFLVAGPAGVIVGMLGLGAAFEVALRASRRNPLGNAAAVFVVVRGIQFLSEGTLQLQDLVVLGLSTVVILGIGRATRHAQVHPSQLDIA